MPEIGRLHRVGRPAGRDAHRAPGRAHIRPAADPPHERERRRSSDR
ncbi:hypothetical protein KPATCC21470_3152 [Kitasatospora purpeofusca]